MGGMEVALVGTDDARRCTCLDHCPHLAKIRRGLSRHDPSSGVAFVGAVEAESNDANHLAEVGFAQAGVGAGSAARAAIETFFDAPQQDLVIDVGRLWMQSEHLFESHAPLTSSGQYRVARACTVTFASTRSLMAV